MSSALYFVLLTTGLAGHFFTADADFVDKRNCSTNADNLPDSSDASDEDSDQDGVDQEADKALVLYGANLPVEEEDNGAGTSEEQPEEETEEEPQEEPDEESEEESEQGDGIE